MLPHLQGGGYIEEQAGFIFCNDWYTILLNDTLAPLSGVKLGPLCICHGVLSVASPHRLVKYFFTTAEKLQGGFFDWSPLKCLSMELVLAPQFQTGPPPTQNVIKFVKELQYNT